MKGLKCLGFFGGLGVWAFFGGTLGIFLILAAFGLADQAFGEEIIPPWAAAPPRGVIPIARPNPYDRGNCYQWKGCKGESIGSMPVDQPEFCGPLGGKSWKNMDGECLDLPEGPRATEPLPDRPKVR